MSKSIEFWDKAAKNYDKTEQRFQYIHSQSRQKTKKYLKDSDIVLDFGCGTGTTACELAKQVKQIHGIDISSKMIDIAKQKAATVKAENITFSQTNIFDKSYDDHCFDTILAFNMLHTVANPEQVTKRLYQLLKPERLFISITPCLREKRSLAVNLQIQLVRVLGKIGVIPIALRRLKSAEVEALIANAGFQLIETEKIFQGASSYFVVAKKSKKVKGLVKG